MENETNKDEDCEVNTNKVDQSEDDTLIISTKMEDEDQLDYEGEANTSDFQRSTHLTFRDQHTRLLEINTPDASDKACF